MTGTGAIRTAAMGLVLATASLPGSAALAHDRLVLSCLGDTVFACAALGCAEPQTLYASMTIDYGAGHLDVCVGEGCYAAAIRIIRTKEGGEMFVFDARRSPASGGGSHAGTVTIHPGRHDAMAGQFLADGTVLFSPMRCSADGAARR